MTEFTESWTTPLKSGKGYYTLTWPTLSNSNVYKVHNFQFRISIKEECSTKTHVSWPKFNNSSNLYKEYDLQGRENDTIMLINLLKNHEVNMSIRIFKVIGQMVFVSKIKEIEKKNR